MKTKRTEPDHRQLKRIGIECVNINLRRVSRVINRLFDEALEPAGISSSQFSVLIAVAIYEGITISALADIISKERTTLTRNLSPLEKNGWIRIERGEDARSRSIHMTDAGRAVLERALPLREKAHEKVVRIMGTEDWKQARRTLMRLLKT